MTTNNDSTTTWSDQMGSRSRRAWLLLIKGEEITAFNGQNVDRVAVIRGTSYSKNGKWSHTTYRIELAPGVRAISGKNGWETGRFVEGLRSAVSFSSPIDTWADVANAMKVSVPSVMEFLRNWRPKAAEALDKVDAALTALDDAADEAEAVQDTETVVVSFGSPTRRMRADGFWTSPKSIPNHDGELRLIDADKGWTKDNITVVGVLGTVMSATHSSGHGGGYVSVTVAIVPGTESEIPHFVSEQEKAAQESDLPEELFRAFGGNTDCVKEFMGKVSQLDGSKLDEHEMSCGRARKEAEVIRVSGDPDFFLGADPLEVCRYIEENASATTTSKPAPKPTTTAPEPTSSGTATMADLMAKFGRK